MSSSTDESCRVCSIHAPYFDADDQNVVEKLRGVCKHCSLRELKADFGQLLDAMAAECHESFYGKLYQFFGEIERLTNVEVLIATVDLKTLARLASIGSSVLMIRRMES